MLLFAETKSKLAEGAVANSVNILIDVGVALHDQMLRSRAFEMSADVSCGIRTVRRSQRFIHTREKLFRYFVFRIQKIHQAVWDIWFVTAGQLTDSAMVVLHIQFVIIWMPCISSTPRPIRSGSSRKVRSGVGLS